jgi:hypothetical protein
MMRFARVAVVAVCLVLVGASAHAASFTVQVLPPPASVVGGAPGEALSWRLEVQNLDQVNWLMFTSLVADAEQHGTPDASAFPYPILAPADSWSGVAYRFTWDADAPVGFVNAGLFMLTAEAWDGDPLEGGQPLDLEPESAGAEYYGVVTEPTNAVPEPATMGLLAIGLAVFAGRRLRASR